MSPSEGRPRKKIEIHETDSMYVRAIKELMNDTGASLYDAANIYKDLYTKQTQAEIDNVDEAAALIKLEIERHKES